MPPPPITARHSACFCPRQQIHAGEVLHLLERSYFPYDGGHTLRFAEKTIRLASLLDEHEAIIANAGNAWFQPLP
jgi:hypothetical protein